MKEASPHGEAGAGGFEEHSGGEAGACVWCKLTVAAQVVSGDAAARGSTVASAGHDAPTCAAFVILRGGWWRGRSLLRLWRRGDLGWQISFDRGL